MVFSVGSKVTLRHGTENLNLSPKLKYYHGSFMNEILPLFTNNNIGYTIHGDLYDLYPDKDFRNRESDNLEGKKIIFIRSGGAGDMLFLSPFMKWIHDRGAEVSIATKEKYRKVLLGQEYIQYALSLPLETVRIESRDYYVSVRGLIEGFGNNVYDLVSKYLDIPLSDSEKRPVWKPLDEHEGLVKQYLESISLGNKLKIGVQTRATAIIRTWPYFEHLIKLLIELGHDVFVFGEVNELHKMKRLSSRHLYFPQLDIMNDFRLSGALIKHLDLMITPDSSMYHFAEAVGTKTIAIFGPFAPSDRTKYYKYVYTISPENGAGGCVPCHIHAMYCPKANFPEGISPCLMEIRTEHIMEAMNIVLSDK